MSQRLDRIELCRAPCREVAEDHAELLRRVYVDVAVKGFAVAGKPQTNSRITLLTGVHRKDVKRLRAEPRVALDAPRLASLSSQLIARARSNWRIVLASTKVASRGRLPRRFTVQAPIVGLSPDWNTCSAKSYAPNNTWNEVDG